jgi:hypothetical protein
MALKELRKSSKVKNSRFESKINKFISKGGTLATEGFDDLDGDHRLTLRIPKALMNKVDAQRKKRVGKISRNLWILEIIEKATQK